MGRSSATILLVALLAIVCFQLTSAELEAGGGRKLLEKHWGHRAAFDEIQRFLNGTPGANATVLEAVARDRRAEAIAAGRGQPIPADLRQLKPSNVTDSPPKPPKKEKKEEKKAEAPAPQGASPPPAQQPAPEQPAPEQPAETAPPAQGSPPARKLQQLEDTDVDDDDDDDDSSDLAPAPGAFAPAPAFDVDELEGIVLGVDVIVITPGRKVLQMAEDLDTDGSDLAPAPAFAPAPAIDVEELEPALDMDEGLYNTSRKA